MSISHHLEDIINLFDQCFANTFNTRLIKGKNEPIYLPADHTDIGIPAQSYAQVVFAHGYYSSALHEIAHWCLAGEERRKKVDFGYWYCPDGRTSEQQMAFEKVEVKPQAIEWAFCLAAGFEFNVSCDNLSGDELGRQPDHHEFRKQVHNQVAEYLQRGFPARAITFIKALSEFYSQPEPNCLSMFVKEKQSFNSEVA